LDWPFFELRHKELASALSSWGSANIAHEEEGDVAGTCRALVRQLGSQGWLKYAIAGKSYGAAHDVIDTRSLCLLREGLAEHSGLADFAFAMQGLGSGAISLFGDAAQKQRYLPAVAQGNTIAAFALSETDAGSDPAALQCAARLDGDYYSLDGEKTWISNGGLADFYVTFARTGEAPGARGISAFIIDANTPGFSVAESMAVMAPHPLARITFKNCRVPSAQRIGLAGQGFKIAMATLDVFRTSVAAAATGFARSALRHALQRALSRRVFGNLLFDFQSTQAKLAEMATHIDAAALLTYRAAWLRDQGVSVTAEAAMAKMAATESAQRVIDSAVQIFGALGVMKGHPVERLYREIRPLRIYEGATEIQLLIIARELAKAYKAQQHDETRL
jgi:acyl-CoA dehydrogenase